MKKFVLFILMLLIIVGCNIDQNHREETEENEKPETTVVRLAQNDSGHILNFIAEEMGYLAEEGIRVEYVHVETDAEVFEGLRNGTIDVASNSGTNLPLEKISSGMDLTIFGGYLLTGCMPIFTRVETEWNSIEDLIGKTMACEPNLYAITGRLYAKGYDPLNEISWYQPEDQKDRITAVKNGEADFGLVGTALNYAVLSDPDLKVVTYAADVMPNYSCCRAEALTSWVNEHPNTVKALLRAWIRALEYAEDHHEEIVAFTAEKIGVDEQVVRAYFDNPRFNLNPDPMKKAITRAWNYMDYLGLLDEKAQTIDILDHINVSLYKEALDECTRRYGQDNPKFYERLQAQYATNNQ